MLRALLVCVFLAPAVVTQFSQAGFTNEDVSTHVEIDGVDYGAFDSVEGLDQIIAMTEESQEFTKPDVEEYMHYPTKPEDDAPPSCQLYK